jgi:hypothetical protein
VAVVPGQQACGRPCTLLRGWSSRHNRTMAQTRKDKQSDDAPPPRRGRAAALGPDAELAAKNALQRAGFTDPTLVLRWEEIAGTETARLAQPIKLGEDASGGVLTLRAEPGAALFLQHESRALCDRINTYLGRAAINRLRFVQGPLNPRNRPPPPKAAKEPVPPADPVRQYQGPDVLREALLKLAQARRAGH